MLLCLTFMRGGQRFAVHLEAVRRVVPGSAVSHLPEAQADVLGVVGDEVQLVPVIRGPLPPLYTDEAKARVILLNNGESPFGLPVDRLERPGEVCLVGRLDALPLSLRPPLEGVPEEAVEAIVLGMPELPAQLDLEELVVLLNPSALYRARLTPGEL